MAHSVYIIRCGGSKLYKIGVSSDVSNRLEALQSACP